MVEATQASTLKALMQLHAFSPIKQRAGRDKRAIRSMLQDSKEVLLQSIAVTAQTGLQNASSHLAMLHCLSAVQESVPAPAAALSTADAPPGFAPKAQSEPTVFCPFALKLWPFNEPHTCNPQPRQWPAQDPSPLLQLLRLHNVLASKGKQPLPQQLLLDILQSASTSASHSPSLASRLVEEVRAASPDQHSAVASRLDLLELQLLHSRGDSCSTTAVEQLWVSVLSRLSKPRTPSSSASTSSATGIQHDSRAATAEGLLQLAKWSHLPDGVTSGKQTGMRDRLRALAFGSNGSSELFLPADASEQAVCLAAAVKLVPQSAAAWLAYADYLHKLSQATPTADFPLDPLSDKSINESMSGGAATSTWHSHQTVVEMVQAYCAHLKLAVQSFGQAGMVEDHIPILLKLLHLLTGDQVVAEVLQAVKAGVESFPVLTWRPVVPQLFALLAHDEANVWNLAQELSQALELLDPAAVLYPALVESRRSIRGHIMHALHAYAVLCAVLVSTDQHCVLSEHKPAERMKDLHAVLCMQSLRLGHFMTKPCTQQSILSSYHACICFQHCHVVKVQQMLACCFAHVMHE